MAKPTMAVAEFSVFKYALISGSSKNKKRHYNVQTYKFNKNLSLVIKFGEKSDLKVKKDN